jgi:hypothetical protein
LSLREMARYLSSRPELQDVAAVWLDAGTSTKSRTWQIARIMGHFGFESIPEPEPITIGKRVHIFFENILISLFVFAQNAHMFRFDVIARGRVPLFVSRRALLQRFGVGEEAATRAVDPSR